MEEKNGEEVRFTFRDLLYIGNRFIASSMINFIKMSD